ncbi:hypothetical protein ES702_01186 [subsurface metagenome]
MEFEREFSTGLEQEVSPEAEPRPEKVFLLIRHPSTRMERAIDESDPEQSWDDIEEDIRIDRKGGTMSRSLLDYLTSTTLEKDVIEVDIYTSPAVRAKSLAESLEKKLDYEHRRNQNIPVAKKGVYAINQLRELPLKCSIREVQDCIKAAKKEGKSPMTKWMESDPERATNILNNELPRIKENLAFLQKSPANINFVVTHRLVIAFSVWVVQKQEQGEVNEVNKEDLKDISTIADQIDYTSITELQQIKGELKLGQIGQTSHLSTQS